MLPDRPQPGDANLNDAYYLTKLKVSTCSEQSIEGITERYFEGSFSNVVSYWVDKKQMLIEDLELLLKEFQNKLIAIKYLLLFNKLELVFKPFLLKFV